MAKLQVHQFPALNDNYGFLIHDAETGVTASIDAPEESAVRQALADTGWALTHILTTHHHADHTQANAPLKASTGCMIVGPRPEASKVPGIDVEVGEGDTFDFGGHIATVHETPGHTLGHIVYHFADDGVCFAGDTLFPLGCGRVFEGTMDQMWSSMEKMAALPPETVVYSAHEYTQANAAFAVTAEPDNAALKARAVEIDALRAEGKPTVPTTIALELETNPFLRAGSAGRFAEVRTAKDNF
ncbi:MAG: hydroxyacylglutathione hydrolase [Pseudomonadota bacterium]